MAAGDTNVTNLVASGTVTAATLVAGSTTISEAEIGVLDGVTAGTVTASKAVVVSSTKAIDTLLFTAATLAATGNSQGTAAPIVSETVYVTAADGTTAVLLPTAVAGRRLVVINTVTSAVLPVYPATGAAINAAAANAAVNLPAAAIAVFYATSATQWYAELVPNNITATSTQINTNVPNAIIGVASGYKIARSASPVALGGSNPTTVASGLTTIVAAGVCLSGTAAPGLSTSTLSVAINTTNLDIYAWKPTAQGDTTLVASTGTESFHWWAIGT